MRRSILLTAVLACACGEPIPAVPPDAGACVVLSESLARNDPEGLDLLFLIDDSNSMGSEQAALARELPALVEALASGDFDRDGVAESEPIPDLHLGVITSDMGSGGHAVATCARPDVGADGLLRTDGNLTAGCSVSYPPFLAYAPGAGTTPAEVGRDLACLAIAGVSGCGFEQPLEAILKALSPAAPTAYTREGYVPPVFAGGAAGHGDGANDGFSRPHAVLAIVALTDEDDCSASDLDLFDLEAGRYAETEPNLRCSTHPEALHPIDRYVEGLLQLRRSPGLLVYAPIAGIPTDLEAAPGARPDFERLVSDDLAVRDPRMQPRVDPEQPTRLATSCSDPSVGAAFPPVRMVELGRELDRRGAGVSVGSICRDDYRGALAEIARNFRSALQADCVPGPELRLEPDGTVACELDVVLPRDLGCADLSGATPRLEGGVAVVEDGRAVCTLAQLAPTERTPGARGPAGSGWYYDTFSALAAETCGSRIAIEPTPPGGSTLRFRCFEGSLPGAPCL